MSISAISFSSAKKHKNNNIVRNNDEQVKVSVPKNYKIVIKPDKEKLVMIPQMPEDEFVSSEADKPEKSGKTSKKNNKSKAEKETKKKNETAKNGENSAIEKAKKITRIVMAVIMTALSALGIKEGKDMLEYEPDITSTTIGFNSEENNISDIAGIYNIDEDVIRYSNGIYSDDDLRDADSLIIPTQYDYLSDVMDSKTQALYKAKPYSPEYYSLGKELEALNTKQEEQETVADIFTDGETVYISLKNEEENPELAKKYEDKSIPIDYIEKLFDIKDGELNKYNTFASTNNGQSVPFGVTLKVPLSAIDTENVNLSGYLK